MPIQWTDSEAGEVRNILASHFKGHPPGNQVWVFGSRVLGKAKPFSDLDLIVAYGAPAEFGVLHALKEAFSESRLPYRVDVHDWNAIPEAWKAEILKVRELIFSDG